MSLPVVSLPTSTVDIGGTSVEYRSLSRAEVLKVRTFVGDEDGAENFLISCATGITVEEAAEWRAATDAVTAGILIDAAIELSGLNLGGVGKGPK